MIFILIVSFFPVPDCNAHFVTIGDARFLMFNGYRYYKNNGYNDSVYWLCQGYQRFGCAARATTKNNRLKSTKGTHNHPVTFQSYQ